MTWIPSSACVKVTRPSTFVSFVWWSKATALVTCADLSLSLRGLMLGQSRGVQSQKNPADQGSDRQRGRKLLDRHVCSPLG